MNLKTPDGGWNPYFSGALVGLLMVLSVAIAGKYFGASTTMVRAAGMIEKQVAPENVETNDYFKKETPKFDWQWLFVVGIFVGALIAALAFKDFKMESVPPIWTEKFGTGVGLRAIIAFVGGFIAILGARLANGCPSGHGLSGGQQLAVSGYISLVCFFVGGLIVANLMYRGRAKE